MQDTTETDDTTRSARLEARVSNDHKRLFQQAAALSGQTLSEFVIESTRAAAVRIVEDHEIMRLAREEQRAFVAALLAPSTPGARLRKAAETYRRKTER